MTILLDRRSLFGGRAATLAAILVFLWILTCQSVQPVRADGQDQEIDLVLSSNYVSVTVGEEVTIYMTVTNGTEYLLGDMRIDLYYEEYCLRDWVIGQMYPHESKTEDLVVSGDESRLGELEFRLVASGVVVGGISVEAEESLTVLTLAQSAEASFEQNIYTVTETAATAVVTVSLSAPVVQTMTVDYATSDGTAMAGEDYIAVNGTLVFEPGITVLAFAVPITDDVSYEGDETVNMSLFGEMSGTTRLMLDEAVLTIVDDDESPSLTFSRDIYRVDEDAGSVEITATFSTAVVVTVTAEYSTSDSAAVAGQDYITTTGVLTFSPGVTEQSFIVPILDDTKEEADEIFVVDLSMLGQDDQSLVKIIDNDGLPRVNFAVSEVIVNEGDGIVPVLVRLSRVFELTATVRYTFMDYGSTVTEGEDFVLSDDNLLVFPPGTTVVTVPVTIVDDSRGEGTETLQLGLYGASAVRIGSQRTNRVLIEDNDDFMLVLPLVLASFPLPPELPLPPPFEGPVALTIHSGGEIDETYLPVRDGRILSDYPWQVCDWRSDNVALLRVDYDDIYIVAIWSTVHGQIVSAARLEGFREDNYYVWGLSLTDSGLWFHYSGADDNVGIAFLSWDGELTLPVIQDAYSPFVNSSGLLFYREKGKWIVAETIGAQIVRSRELDPDGPAGYSSFGFQESSPDGKTLYGWDALSGLPIILKSSGSWWSSSTTYVLMTDGLFGSDHFVVLGGSVPYHYENGGILEYWNGSTWVDVCTPQFQGEYDSVLLLDAHDYYFLWMLNEHSDGSYQVITTYRSSPCVPGSVQIVLEGTYSLALGGYVSGFLDPEPETEAPPFVRR